MIVCGIFNCQRSIGRVDMKRNGITIDEGGRVGSAVIDTEIARGQPTVLKSRYPDPTFKTLEETQMSGETLRFYVSKSISQKMRHNCTTRVHPSVRVGLARGRGVGKANWLGNLKHKNNTVNRNYARTHPLSTGSHNKLLRKNITQLSRKGNAHQVQTNRFRDLDVVVTSSRG